jgi:hypothetical protein
MVKDGAIPPQGRQVRCAACKHSWHQEPDAADIAPSPTSSDRESEATVDAPRESQGSWDNDAAAGFHENESEDAAAETEQSLTEATLIDPRDGIEAEERAFEAANMPDAEAPSEDGQAEAPAAFSTEGFGAFASERQHAPDGPAANVAEEWPPRAIADSTDPGAAPEPVMATEPVSESESADWAAPPGPEAQDDEFSPFASREPADLPRRRGPLKVLLLLLAVAALAAAFWFLAPAEWKARVGLAGDTSSPLALVTEHMDRQQLESGNELLTVTGRVINPTGEEQQVPPLQAQLKSKSGTVVYSWTIAPPARTLPPGASASFNSAEVNVPPGGDELTITLGQPRA